MKKYLNLSNVIYGISILFALGVLLKIYLDRAGLPEGVCPTANNSGLIYLSIGLLIVATVVTSVLDKRQKVKSKEGDSVKSRQEDRSLETTPEKDSEPFDDTQDHGDLDPGDKGEQ